MHELSLNEAVLTVLRQQPGPHRHIRVRLGSPSTPPDELAETFRVHLAAAQPPVSVDVVEVVPLPRRRMCASCGHGWDSGEFAPSCPRCGGPPRPGRHDHTLEVEVLP